MALVSEGTLTQKPLTELYWAIHWKKLSGCLILEQPPHKKQLYFRDGAPFFARSSMKSETLGRFLLHRSLITADGYERATLLSIQDRMKLGDALVKCGAITRQTLDDALLEQTRERFLAAFTLRQAHYSFAEGLPQDLSQEAGRIDMLTVLRDGVGRYHDFEFLTAALQGWSRGAIRRTAAFNLLILSLPLDADEARVVSAVDDHRRIGDLLAFTGKEPQRLFPILYLLRSVGLLRGENEPDPSFSLPSTVSSAESLDEKLAEITSGGEPAEPRPRKRLTLPLGFRVPGVAGPPPQPTAEPLLPPSLPPPVAPSPEPLPSPALAQPPVPSLPPPGPGRTSGFVPRTFGFVRHDEEEFSVDVATMPNVTLPPPPNTGSGSVPAVLPAEPAPFMLRPQEQVVIDMSTAAVQRVPALPSAPKTQEARSGVVKGVIEAAQAHSRGLAALKIGDLETAVEQLQKAMALHPGEFDYMVGLASALFVREKTSASGDGLGRALELVDRVLASQKKHAKAHGVRALCLRELGRMQEFSAELQQAVKLEPELANLEDGLMAPFRSEPGKTGGILGRASGLFRRKT